MFLSVMASPPGALLFRWLSLGLVRGQMRDDVRAAIEPAMGAQLQISTMWVAARAREQPLCCFRRRSEGEARRAPGTLADADRALALEQIECRGDGGAGETAAALQRSEIVADAALYVFDRRAECSDI